MICNFFFPKENSNELENVAGLHCNDALELL